MEIEWKTEWEGVGEGSEGPARKTPQIGQNFSLSSHNKPKAEKLVRLGEIIKRQLLQRLIADIRTPERDGLTDREGERVRVEGRGEHDMKHNANVVVDNFINIKFCIHQSAASSTARDEAEGGRMSVCRRCFPALLLVLPLEPVPLRFARFTQYAGRFLFVLMFVDMERPKVIVCNTIAWSPYGLLLHRLPPPSHPLTEVATQRLHNLPFCWIVALLYLLLLPNKRLKCWPGINAFTPLSQGEAVAIFLADLPRPPSTTYLSLCVALFVYVFIIAAQPKWPWLYGCVCMREREIVF